MKSSVLIAILCLAMNASALNAQPSIVGRVLDDVGNPVEGVCVSDGVQVVKTGADGSYELQSAKRQGLVFISIPSGYTVATRSDGFSADFWKTLKKPAHICETADFRLDRQNQSEYSVVFVTDVKLSGNSDLDGTERFRSEVVPTIKNAYETAATGGHPVFVFNLGNLNGADGWIGSNWRLDSSCKELSAALMPGPMFSVPGNNDYDPTVVGTNADFGAGHLYRACLGPEYYSVNIGKDHWVMLDNIIYKNTAEEDKSMFGGFKGKRDYEIGLTEDVFKWLEQDLATVGKGQTVRLCTHAPLLSDSGKSTTFARHDDLKRLVSMLSAFDGRVHTYSGHSDMMCFVSGEKYPEIENMILPSAYGYVTCGSSRLCIDGTPAGIVTAHFAAESAPEYAFYSCGAGQEWMCMYDLNEVISYYQKYAALKAVLDPGAGWTDYGSEFYHNCVLANVWMLRPGDVVRMFDGRRELEVENILGNDPAVPVCCLSSPATNGRLNAKKFRSPHLFAAKTGKSRFSVRVCIYDKDGRLLHEEKFNRPIPFKPDL